MPKKTEKDKIIGFLVENAIDQIEFEDIRECQGICDDDIIDHIMDEVIEDVILVSSFRRGVYNAVPKTMKWSLDILTQLDDNRFLEILRVRRAEFDTLVNLISDYSEFNQPHSCQQFPMEYQLAILLFRLGTSGEGASINKIAAFFGVGDGGTIDKVTQRVFNAFLHLQSKYIYWPDEEERTSIVAETYNELPFCIGYVDGSEIPLSEKPILNGISFFSRTHKYSIKAQVICDYKLRIRHVVVGNPGSVHDSKIFRNCDIYKHPEKYFSSHQWIAGDSAYSLSTNVITPYRSNSNQMDMQKRKRFNRRHSSYRVRIEHVFGILKEKFGSLKNLKMRINSQKNHTFCCQWIIVCCILHNILLSLREGQEPEPIVEDEETDEDFEETDEMNAPNAKNELKRQAIYSLMFD